MINFKIAFETTVVRVVFKKMGHRGQVAQIIKGDDVKFVRVFFLHDLENLPADSSETVNSYFCCHCVSPS